MSPELAEIKENLKEGVYDIDPWAKEDITFLLLHIEEQKERYNRLYGFMVKEFLTAKGEDCPF